MSKTEPTPPRRKRQAKGRRPFFFDDPNVDKLLAIVTALVGEVAVLRHRLDTHERVAEARGAFSAGDIEAFAPTPEQTEAMAQWRSEYLQRVFRILDLEADSGSTSDAERDYEKMIARFASE